MDTRGRLLMLAFWLALLILKPAARSQEDHQPGINGFCSSIIAPFTQYSCAEHTVATKDGFILGVQNIVGAGATRGRAGGAVAGKGAVLFLAGTLISAGDVWFYNKINDNPGSNPTPLAAADQGFNVWIGHYRASPWSFGHPALNSTQREHWDWCTDELARFDFPALVEFVFAKNNQKSLHLVAYSEGSRVAVAAMSLNPKVAAEVLKSATLVAPPVYLRHVRSPLMSGLSLSRMAETAYDSGAGQFSFAAFSTIFPSSIDSTTVKQQLLATFMGESCCTDPTLAYNILTGALSYTSFKQIASLTQGMRFGSFQAYDYGSTEANMRRYNGSSVAPSYDMNGIIINVPTSLPLLVVYGGQDGLANHHDVRNFTQSLPKPPRLLYLKNYSHIDFVFSPTIDQDLNLPIFHFLSLASN